MNKTTQELFNDIDKILQQMITLIIDMKKRWQNIEKNLDLINKIDKAIK